MASNEQATQTATSPGPAPSVSYARTRRNAHESQALYSLAAAGVGALGVIAVLGLFVRNFQWAESELKFGAGSLAYYGYIAGVGLAGLGGLVGMILGFQSAGQKRNSLNRLSWLGFFASAALVTIAACGGLIFAFLKEIVQSSH